MHVTETVAAEMGVRVAFFEVIQKQTAVLCKPTVSSP